MIAQGVAVALVCQGVATVEETDVARSQSDFDVTSSVRTEVSRTARLSERMSVEIGSGSIRVRPPRSLEPALGGRGEDGWRTLTDTEVTAERIVGSYAYNWISRYRVTIDRMTGEVRLEPRLGGGTFEGVCEVAPSRQTPLF